MTLVDTSVWVKHLRHGDDRLGQLLVESEVICHPLVIGELACGSIKNRNEVLDLLSALPQASVAEHAEVIDFLHANDLSGRGLGWIDVHLLASALLSDAKIWTLDRRLREAVDRL
jgi:predicted nucleic acid-binding protein